jgi:hypothetical protein
MKPAKSHIGQSKPTGVGIMNQRKPSMMGGAGKENINTSNAQVKLSERKQQTKEGSPLDSGSRCIQGPSGGSFLTCRGLPRQEKTALQKAGGSQDRNSLQEQRERSCTPGSIKEFMAKVRMQSFHMSPKENFKVNFKGRTLKMGSPKNQKAKYTFDYSAKVEGKGVSSSSPKSRQITKEFFYTEGNKLMTTDGNYRVKEAMKGSLLSHDTYNYNHGSQDSLIGVEKVKCTPTCINHPLKKSKFFLTDLQRLGHQDGDSTLLKGVCSKCAVRLASAGHHIEEIHPDDNEIRKKTFSKLIQRITTVMSLVKLTKEHISMREEKVFSFYKSQLEILKDIQTQIDKIFTNFIRNSEQLKKTLSDDHQRQLNQCNELKSQLSRKEVELQNLAKHLTECHSNGDVLADYSSTENQIGNFNEALSTTVEDCKSLHEMSFTLSKLTSGIQLLAPQIDSKLQDLLKLRPSDLMFQLQTSEKYSQQLGLWTELNKPIKNSIIAESSVDTTSWNEYNGYREQVLSFDKKTLNETSNKEHNYSVNSLGKDSPSKNFGTILERIDGNQTETMKYYSTILSEENEQLFHIEADSAAFNQQQTPELGVKEQAPTYLREQLALLQTNYKNISLQKKQSTFTHDQGQGDKLPVTSQEKTFKSESSQQTNFTEVREHIHSQIVGSLIGSEGHHFSSMKLS